MEKKEWKQRSKLKLKEDLIAAVDEAQKDAEEKAIWLQHEWAKNSSKQKQRMQKKQEEQLKKTENEKETNQRK